MNPSYPIFSGWNFGFMQKLGRFGAFSPRRRRLLLPGPLRCFSTMCVWCALDAYDGSGWGKGCCWADAKNTRMLWGENIPQEQCCGAVSWLQDVGFGGLKCGSMMCWFTVFADGGLKLIDRLRDTAFYIFYHSLIITGSVGPSRISNGSPTRWRRWGTWRWAQMFVAGRTVLLLCSCDLAQRRSWQSDRVED